MSELLDFLCSRDASRNHLPPYESTFVQKQIPWDTFCFVFILFKQALNCDHNKITALPEGLLDQATYLVRCVFFVVVVVVVVVVVIVVVRQLGLFGQRLTFVEILSLGAVLFMYRML